MLGSTISLASRGGTMPMILRAAGASIFAFTVLPNVNVVAAETTDSTALSHVSLEEIVVTARRAEESLQETPVSILAIGGDQLESTGLDSLRSSEAFLPNVGIGSSMGTGTGVANFAIRGIGGAATGYITQDSGVGVYVDDVLLAHPNGALLDMIDVERLEVLRGPQGTLFGRNTAGGAIRYVSKLPNAELGGNIKATLGSYDRRDLTGVLNIPLSDTLSTRLTFAKKDRAGYITRLIDGLKTGDDHVSSMRGQLRWQPSDKLDINFSVDSTQSFDHGVATTIETYWPGDAYWAALYSATPSPAVVALRTYTPSVVVPVWSPATAADIQKYDTNEQYTVYGGDPDHDEFESTGLGLTLQYDLTDNLTLKSISGYNKTTQRQLQDNDRTPIVMYAGDVHFNFEYFTQEFQLNGNAFNDRLKWVGGAFYMHDKASDHRLRISPLDPVYNNPENKDQLTKTYAVFGQGSFSFTDIFSATAGVRWSLDEKDITAMRGGRNNSQPVSNSDDWSSVTPRIGLEQKWTQDLMTYVSAAKGFKAGGFVDTVVNTNPSSPAAVNNGIYPFDPETLWTYEAGLRSEFLDHRIRLNATAFYTDYQDIQVAQTLLINGIPSLITTNLGLATVKGAELEVTAAVTEKLTLSASGGYTNARYDDSIVELTRNPVTGLSGFNPSVPFLRTPEYSYTVAAAFDQPLENGAALNVNVNWGWKDWQLSSSTPANAVYMPAYGLLNGRLEYVSGKNWSVAVFGTNLLDEYYVTGGIDASGPTTKYTYNTTPHDAVLGQSMIDVGRPREAGIEFKYTF